MKQVARIVALSVAATLLVLLVMGFILPNRYHVQRSILIDAPADAVHPWIDDLRRWPGWAHWNRPPDTVIDYGEPSHGVGARETWSDQRGGKGSVTIVRSDPKLGVEFTTQLADGTLGTGSISYAESVGTTTLTWTDQGQLPRIFGGFFRGHFEDVLGEHFDEGLKRLKQAVERERTGR